MNEQRESQYLTDCENCVNNSECPCLWDIGCSTCILIQHQVEEK